MTYSVGTCRSQHAHSPHKPRFAGGSSRRAIRLAVISAHPLVRQGLRAVVRVSTGLELVGEASHGAEAAQLITATRPHVVLFDLALPETESLTAIAAIKRANPRTRVIVLATFAEPTLSSSAVRAGADHILLKDVAVPELIRTIRGARPDLQRRSQNFLASSE
jgi:DNA-binding NarL/FixJ family response regulator